MIHAGMIQMTPHVTYNEEDNSVDIGVSLETVGEMADAVNKTGRAIALGMAIAAIDGPLPIADVIGFGIAVVGAGLAWWDFFDDRI